MDKALARLSISIMVLLVLTVLFQVFMRYVMNSPVTFTEELSRFLLIWVGLFAASYAYRQRMHLALDLLVLKLSDSGKKKLNIVINLLIALFAVAVLIYGGGQLVYLTYILEQHSAAMGLSLSIVYLALPLSGIAITIYAVDFILQELGLSESTLTDQNQSDAEDVLPE